MLGTQFGDLILGVLDLLDHLSFLVWFLVSLVFLDVRANVVSVAVDLLARRCSVLCHALSPVVSFLWSGARGPVVPGPGMYWRQVMELNFHVLSVPVSEGISCLAHRSEAPFPCCCGYSFRAATPPVRSFGAALSTAFGTNPGPINVAFGCRTAAAGQIRHG